MAELSPAAQAALDAFRTSHTGQGCLAAALRAAADQVVPDDPSEAMHFTTEAIRLNRMGTRAALLAIAAELDGAQAEQPRRQVFPTPHQIAECGGPCEQGGPEACDCGLYERSASKSTH